MKWIIAFLIFSLLILFHEYGHFLVAKMSGVTVEEFSLGFGPRLLTTVYKGTRYSVKLLLFGGSCQMKGELDEYDEETGEWVESGAGPEEGSFQSVSLGKRAAIVFAGPFFNFLLAFIGAVIVIGVVGYDPAEVLYVAPGSPAAEAGLAEGDMITEFMGERVVIGRDVSTWSIFHDLTEETELSLTYERDGEKHSVVFDPYVTVRYMMGINYNLDEPKAVIQAVSEGAPFAEAGGMAGDVVISINGNEITTSQSMNEYFDANPMDGSEMTIVVLRGGEEVTLTFTPVESRSLSAGFSYNLGRVNTSPIGVIRYSLTEVRYWIQTVVKSLGAMFTGRFGVQDLSGPVGVVDIVSTTYEETKEEGPLMTWMNMINLIILLSANLGVMNLLPIPGVDGGRLLFLAIEAIRRRPMDRKVEMITQTVALGFLVILMVVVMYNDILRLIG